jgi:hypothetical protein
MTPLESVEQHPPVSSRSRRRWYFWVVGLLLLLVLWLAALFGYFAYRANQSLREAMAEADQDTPGGWQLDDLEARREKVPDEENAALVVRKVASLLPPAWPVAVATGGPGEQEAAKAGDSPGTWMKRFHELPPEVPLDAAVLHGLRANLAAVEPARAEARKLTSMRRGRFPLEWTDNIFSTQLQSQEARRAATLLRYAAFVASHDGDDDGALQCVRGLVACSRAVGDEGLLISVLIRFACAAQAVAALERALAHGEPSAAELEAVQALLEEEAAAPLLVQAVRGERAGMHQTLLFMRAHPTTLAQVTGATGGVEKALLGLSSPTLVRRSHPRMLRLFNEFVAAAQLPPEEQPAVVKGIEQKIIQAKLNYDIVTALLMPAMLKVTEANRRNIGNLRCASVAVAVERYRRDHGRWPDPLDALVPKYLAAVPKDPQDGKPLRYQRRTDGCVIYWVGPDGTDDGGKLDRVNSLTKGTDQGFQLWDVKRRRQPDGS